MKYLGIAVSLIILTFLSAVTMHSLWMWFIVPLGAVSINYIHAYGLTVLFGFLQGIRGINYNEDNTIQVIKGYIMVLFSLLVGYVAHLLMGIV